MDFEDRQPANKNVSFIHVSTIENQCSKTHYRKITSKSILLIFLKTNSQQKKKGKDNIKVWETETMAVAASTSTVLVPRLLTTTNVTRCSALPYLPPRLSTTSPSSSLFLKHSISGTHFNSINNAHIDVHCKCN
jgi:hypothetical protein